MQKALNMQEYYDTYYNPKKNGIISESSNPQDDKLAFLKFIKDANLGITLLEIDSDFNFTKLSLKSNGEINPTPCN